MIKTASFVIHHVAVGAGMSAILLTHPFLAYVSAMWMMTEGSTIFLDLKIFARIWGIKWLYMVSGVGVLITYPLTRLLWVPYISFSALMVREYLDHFGCPGAMNVVVMAGSFVTVLSAYYYFAVILAKPRDIVYLR